MTAKHYPLNNLFKLPQTVPPKSDQGGAIDLRSGRSLSRQLLQTLLPVTLLPLAVASGLAILITRQSEQSSALLLLEEESVLASETANIFVEDNFRIIEGLIVSPTIRQAVRQADAEVEESGLANQPIESLEQQFAATKLLKTNVSLNSYLADVVTVEGMAELFITERHGLNVAYSSPTSDFVQR